MDYRIALFVSSLIIYVASQQPPEDQERPPEVQEDKGCSLKIEDLSSSGVPVFLREITGYTKPIVFYPTNEKYIDLEHEDKFLIYCPDAENEPVRTLEYDPEDRTKPGNEHFIVDNKLLTMTCDNGHYKINDGRQDHIVYETEKLDCENMPQPIMKSTDRTCATGAQIYQIGFNAGTDNFITTYKVCFSESEMKTYWLHFVMRPKGRQTRILWQDKNLSKPGLSNNWKKLGDTVYNKDNIYAALEKVTGKAKAKIMMAQNRYSRNGNILKTSLIHPVNMKIYIEQLSTRFYINQVPVWESIGKKYRHWYCVNEYVANYAIKTDHEVHVWTGTLGTLRFKNDEGIESNFYLYKESVSVGVPKVLFECLVDDLEDYSICMIVVNNPFIETSDDYNDHDYCSRHIDCPSELTKELKPEEISYGYTYCCSFKTFLEDNNQYNALGIKEDTARFSQGAQCSRSSG